MTEKTLFERYGDEVLTDNKALNHYAQCKTCIFRDKTKVNGEECGWDKGFCHIYENQKPHEIYKNEIECEYYEEQKLRPE